jgi:ketosteroid isomerase-like protein
MQTRLFTAVIILALVAGLAPASLAQISLTAGPEATRSVPDKAYMQKIWTGWATLDPANVATYYATGPHTFFDIAPLKYNSWDEYQAGVKQILAGYKSATCTVNDDAVVHPHGDLAWGTATVNYEMKAKTGKVEMGTFRWTVVFEKQDGKWLIVHEHVSEPVQQ